MPLATPFDGEECPECGQPELVYWTEDETESVMELYMNCQGCGYEYPKIIIQKSEDTGKEALEARLKERYL